MAEVAQPECQLETLRMRAQKDLCARVEAGTLKPIDKEVEAPKLMEAAADGDAKAVVPDDNALEALRLRAQGALCARVEAGTLKLIQKEEAAAEETVPIAERKPVTDKDLKDDVKCTHLAEELFKIIDTNKSGAIDNDEMKTAHKILASQMNAIFKEGENYMVADFNKDGCIDLPEWMAFNDMMYKGMGPDKFADMAAAASYALRTAFDKDGSANKDIPKLAAQYFDTFAEKVDEGLGLTKPLMIKAMKTMGCDFGADKYDEIWGEASGGAAIIDMTKFEQILAKHYEPKEQADTIKHLYEAFSLFDLNGDGVVTLAEMRAVMMECGSTPLSQEEWAKYEAFFKRADVNGNGELSVSEYIKASLADGA